MQLIEALFKPIIDQMAADPTLILKQMAMWIIGGLLIYLAIKKDMEPTLLLPMGFGAILINLPGISEAGTAENGAFHSCLQGAVQSALVNNSDLGVLDIQTLQGFQDGCLDLAAVLIHDGAGNRQLDAFTGFYGDHGVAGFQSTRHGGFQNFHLFFLLIYVSIGE
jgi:Na+-transporting methylmalonyl-CoA/oxaloacetate decarboxylase beta subunit